TLPTITGMSIFLFVGFEWVTALGYNRNSYNKLIPRAMYTSIIINIIVYSLVVIGLDSQLTRFDIVATPIPHVSLCTKILGNNGVLLAVLLSCLAILSTFNAGVMGGSRLIYALSREGNLPTWCGTISLRTGTPIGAVLLLGFL